MMHGYSTNNLPNIGGESSALQSVYVDKFFLNR
jgi:hypothetical protein